MKKTVSITISGIIFQIEEDGYEMLKRYLDEIQRYFSTYADSREIVSDIEGRIAEVFYKLRGEDSQVITLENVEKLIANLGSVSDFATAEAEYEEDAFQNLGNSGKTYQAPFARKERKLERDEQQKLLAGVCAGIANYLDVDAVWIRLAYLAFFLGLVFLPAVPGFLFIAYIVLWISLPASGHTNPLNLTHKKLFRNPMRKTVGGVASGIAAYFNIDVAIVRVAFVLLLLCFGTGLLLYIILWIITPEAKTVTDRMQMQGEPVTLHNIENNVRAAMSDIHAPSNFSVIIQNLLKGIGAVLRFIYNVFRVLVGVFLLVLSCALLLGLIWCSVGLMLGFTRGSFYMVNGTPLAALFPDLETPFIISAFVFLLVPMLFLLLGSVSALSNKWVLNRAAGWTFFGLWMISAGFTGFYVQKYMGNYASKASIVRENSYALSDTLVVIDREMFENTGPFDSDFELKAAPSDSIHALLVKVKNTSCGPTEAAAGMYASQIIYNPVMKGNTLTLPDAGQSKIEQPYRDQRTEVTVYVPRNVKIKLTENMQYKFWPLPSDNGQQSPVYMFNSQSELVCINCPFVETDGTHVEGTVNISGDDGDVHIEGTIETPEAPDSPEAPDASDEQDNDNEAFEKLERKMRRLGLKPRRTVTTVVNDTATITTEKLSYKNGKVSVTKTNVELKKGK